MQILVEREGSLIDIPEGNTWYEETSLYAYIRHISKDKLFMAFPGVY